MHINKKFSLFGLAVLTLSTFMPLVPVLAADETSTSTTTTTTTETEAGKAVTARQVKLDLWNGVSNSAYKSTKSPMTAGDWQSIGVYMSNFFIPYQTYLTSKAETSDGNIIKMDDDTLKDYTSFLSSSTNMKKDDAKNVSSKILSNMVDPASYKQAGLTDPQKQTTQKLYIGAFVNKKITKLTTETPLNYYDFAGLVYGTNTKALSKRMPKGASDNHFGIYWKDGSSLKTVFDVQGGDKKATAAQMSMLSIMATTDKDNSVMSAFFGDQKFDNPKKVTQDTVTKEYNKSMYGWQMYVDTFGNLISDNTKHRFVILPAASNPFVYQKLDYTVDGKSVTSAEAFKSNGDVKVKAENPGKAIPLNTLQAQIGFNAKTFTLNTDKDSVSDITPKPMGSKKLDTGFWRGLFGNYFSTQAENNKIEMQLLQLTWRSGTKQKNLENYLINDNDQSKKNIGDKDVDPEYGTQEQILDNISFRNYLKVYSGDKDYIIYAADANTIKLDKVNSGTTTIPKGRFIIFNNLELAGKKPTTSWAHPDFNSMKDTNFIKSGNIVNTFSTLAIKSTHHNIFTGNYYTDFYDADPEGKNKDVFTSEKGQIDNPDKLDTSVYPWGYNFSVKNSQDVVVSPDLAKTDGSLATKLNFETTPAITDISVVTSDALGKLALNSITNTNMYSDKNSEKLLASVKDNLSGGESDVINTKFNEEAGKVLSSSLFLTAVNNANNKILDKASNYEPISAQEASSTSSTTTTSTSSSSKATSSSSESKEASGVRNNSKVYADEPDESSSSSESEAEETGTTTDSTSNASSAKESDDKLPYPTAAISFRNMPKYNDAVKLNIIADKGEDGKLSIKKANELMDLSFNFLNPVGSVNFIKTWFINKTNAIVLALHETITGANSSSYTTGTTSYQTYDGFVYQPELGDNSFTNMVKNQFNKFAIFLIAAMLIAVIFYIIVGDITIQQGIIGFIIFAVLIGVPPKLTDGTVALSNKSSTAIMKKKFDYFATFQLEDYMTHVSDQISTDSDGSTTKVGADEITGANKAKVDTSDATKSMSSSQQVDKIISTAKNEIGTPYVWGGSQSKVGLDCSGLTQLAFAKAGITLPRTSQEQEKIVTKIKKDAAQPGDLVFWGSPAYHVGIYLGDDKYIHAPAPGQSVKIQTVSSFAPESYGHPSGIDSSSTSSKADTTGTSDDESEDTNTSAAIDDGIDKPSASTAVDEGAYEKILTDARNTENGSGVSLRWPQNKGENTNGALKTTVSQSLNISDGMYNLVTGAANNANSKEKIEGDKKGSLWVKRQLSDISASSRVIYGNVLMQGANITVDNPDTNMGLLPRALSSSLTGYVKGTSETDSSLAGRERLGFINKENNGASGYGTHKRIYGPLTSTPVAKSTNFTSMTNVTPDTTLGVNSQYSNAMYSYFALGQQEFDTKVANAGSKDTQSQKEQTDMANEKDFSTRSVAGTSIYNLFTESPYYYISWGMMDNGMKSDTQSTGGMKDLLLGSVDGKSDYFYNKTIKSSEPGYGELKDFTDMGSMFNVTIPYLNSLNKQYKAFLEKYDSHEAYKGYGLLGPAYYKIDKNDPDYFKYWYNHNLTRLSNQYSPWVDYLYSSNLSKEEKITYLGKTFEVSNPLDPTAYTSTDKNGKTLGRPMIFSESEMRYYGLKNGDLTTVERKIIEYNKNVHKELLPLMNYYTFHDATMTTIMAMTATFEFNKEFSQISVSDESLVQDPQGWSIGNFSYDAFTRLILSQATNEGLSYSKGSGSNNNEGTYEVEAGDDIDKQDDTTTTRQNDANGNIYERTLAKSGPLVGLLLVISDISAVWIIPALRLLINISVLALTVLILCTGILSIGANIYSLLSKAIIKPLIFTTIINVVYAFAISLLLSNGATNVTGELSPSLSMSPGQALLTTLVFEIALIYFLVKVLRKMVQDSINIGKVTANALRYVSSAATGVLAGAAAGTASKVAGGGSGNTISNGDLYGNNSTGRGSLFSSGDRGRAAAGANNKPAQNRFGGGNPTPDRPRPNSATIPKEMRPKSKSESLDKRIKQGLNKFEDEQTQRTSKNKHVEPTNHTTDTVDKDKEREKMARMRTQPAEKSFKSVFNPTQHSESKETKNPQANTKFAGVGRQSHNKQQEKKPAATSEDINKKINNGLKKK